MSDIPKFKLELHRVDDWEALYVNGEVYGQDHSGVMSLFLGYTLTPFTIDSFIKYSHFDNKLEEYVTDCGHFPDTVVDLAKILKGETLDE